MTSLQEMLFAVDNHIRTLSRSMTHGDTLTVNMNGKPAVVLTYDEVTKYLGPVDTGVAMKIELDVRKFLKSIDMDAGEYAAPIHQVDATDLVAVQGFHGGVIETSGTDVEFNSHPWGNTVWQDASFALSEPDFRKMSLDEIQTWLSDQMKKAITDLLHPPGIDSAMLMADDTPEAKAYEGREKAARDTIDNLVTGKLSTSTIKDVKQAADKALNDRNAGNAIGRAIR